MKRGISPIIATILLISMVVVMGLIIFVWFRGMIEESITKFDDRNIKTICGEVVFDADYSGGSLQIANSGNVPIYKMKLNIYKEGGFELKDLDLFVQQWPEEGLLQGTSFLEEVTFDADVQRAIVIPVLIGESKAGRKSFTCEEKEGMEIFLNK